MGGKNQLIEGTVNLKTGKIQKGDINNAREDKYFHHGIYMFYAITTIVFNICMLNVFIGLLSNVYENKQKKARAYFEEFRLVYAYRMFAARVAFGWVYKKLTGQNTDEGAPNRQDPTKNIAWIAYRF